MGGCLSSKQMPSVDSGATDQQIKDFVSIIRPLDLLVFRGGEGVSTMITKLEKMQTGNDTVSHVEVVITREWCEKIKPINTETKVRDSDTTLFSWGSTMSGPLNDGAYNAETGKSTFGVQIRVLEDEVASYLKNPKANVGLCRLLDNPTLRRKGESEIEYAVRARRLKYDLARAYDLHNGRTYNANPLALLGCMFPSLRPLRTAGREILGKFTEMNQWLFCSEFVAVIYEAIGVITDETDGVKDGKLLETGDVLPVDFLGCDEDHNGIVKPICEIPPIWIKKRVE